MPVLDKSQMNRNGEREEKTSALVIGLTGGAATGKSTVARILRDLGAEVISADDVVHRMMRKGTKLFQEVVSEFGSGILRRDGSLDRRLLGKIVFSNRLAREKLESIVHPQVLYCLKRKIERFRRNRRGILVVEIPLLFEASCAYLVDKILVVTAEQETQIKRLQTKYGITRDEACQRISAQMPLSQKIQRADWVINNDGTIEETLAQVSAVWQCAKELLALPG